MQKIGKKNSFLKKKSVIITALVLAVGIPVGILASQQTTVTQQHASLFNDLNTSFVVTQTNNPDGTMGPVDATGNFSNTFPDVYLGNVTFQATDPPQAHPTSGNSAFGLSHNPNIITSIFSNIFPQNKGNTTQVQSNVPTITPPTQTQDANLTITPPVQGQNKMPFILPQVHLGNNKPSTPSAVHEQDNSATVSANSNQGSPQTVTSLLVTINKVEVHLAHIGLPGSKNAGTAVSPTPSATPGTLGGNLFRKTNQEVDKWETLNIGTPQSLDLVQLANSHVSTLLGNTKLVNGRYTEVRLYISSASATLQNGTQVTLVIPGKSGMVRVVHPFGIDAAKTTSLTMDFDAQNSVILAGTQYILKPVVANMIEKDVQ